MSKQKCAKQDKVVELTSSTKVLKLKKRFYEKFGLTFKPFSEDI